MYEMLWLLLSTSHFHDQRLCINVIPITSNMLRVR